MATVPDYLAPPPSSAIPAELQSIFLGLTVIACLVVLGAALRVGLQRRTAAPVLMVFGGLAAILMETTVTLLGHAVHPEAGQVMMFKAVNRAIPWHIGLGYMAGFGLFYLCLYVPWADGRLTVAAVWKTTVISALLYFVGEAYPVSHGLWVYYDYQPLWLWKGTAPVLWNVLNATCMLTSATLMLVALPHLRGLALLLLVPLAAAGAHMGHLGAGFISYNVVNSTLPDLAKELSGYASVGMAAVIVWLCAQLLVSGAAKERALSS